MIALVAAVTIFFASYGSGLATEHVTGSGSKAGVAFVVAQVVLTTAAIIAL